MFEWNGCQLIKYNHKPLSSVLSAFDKHIIEHMCDCLAVVMNEAYKFNSDDYAYMIKKLKIHIECECAKMIPGRFK